MVADRIETRVFDPRMGDGFEEAELRVARKDDGSRTIRGYAALFDVWSPWYEDFHEIIRPGAFTDTLKSKKSDVRGLFNHNADRVLGRVRAKTMALAVDNKGLFYDIDAPDSAADVVEAIERRDITGSSFSFTVRKTASSEGETWNYDDKGKAERELLAVDLYDVGPVTFPFYPQTKAAVRSLEAWRETLREEERRQQAESRKFGGAIRDVRAAEAELLRMTV